MSQGFLCKNSLCLFLFHILSFLLRSALSPLGTKQWHYSDITMLRFEIACAPKWWWKNLRTIGRIKCFSLPTAAVHINLPYTVNWEHLQKYWSYTPMKYMWKKSNLLCVRLLKLSLKVLFIQRSLLGHLEFWDYYSAVRNITWLPPKFVILIVNIS